MKKKRIKKAVLGLVVVLVCAFVGYNIYSIILDFSIARSALAAPEAESCTLCEFSGRHSPCIVSLHTGEVGELRAYDYGGTDIYGISTKWDGGTFSFVRVPDDLQSWRNSWDQSNHCYVPKDVEVISPEYFCNYCRSILVTVDVRGYVIVDCQDADNFVAYPVAKGKEYTIRGYDVTIETMKEDWQRLEVITTGHYMDGMIPTNENTD